MPMGRSGQSSDAPRTIMIGSFPPKVRCLRATASQRRTEMSESVIFSQPGLARFFPHSHWAIDAAAHVCESAVKVENSPPHNSQQQPKFENNNTNSGGSSQRYPYPQR